MTKRNNLSKNLIFIMFFASQFVEAGLGSYLNGAGVNNRALSGSGVAFSEDSMVASVNPAGLIALSGNGWVLGSIFLTGEQTATASNVDVNSQPDGSFLFTPGRRVAEPDVPAEIGGVFPIPFGAINIRLDNNNALGLSVYGNGGININYKSFDNNYCPDSTPKKGYLCFGDTGSDIAQFFLAATWSRRLSNSVNIGISPQLIYQSIEINGFEIFTSKSSSPLNVSSNGHSGSYGYGVKIGGTLTINEEVTAGITLQSRGYMQNHKEYSGLLPEKGGLDIAPYIHFGIAWETTDSITLLADYQRIYFSKIKSYGNSGNASGLYGEDDGPGFGWEDLGVLKFGFHYNVNGEFTYRLGYSNVVRKPIDKDQVVNNLVSTGIFDQHYNTGISWSYSSDSTLDVGFSYVPKQEIRGLNPLSEGQEIKLSIELFSFDIGLRKSF